MEQPQQEQGAAAEGPVKRKSMDDDKPCQCTPTDDGEDERKASTADQTPKKQRCATPPTDRRWTQFIRQQLQKEWARHADVLRGLKAGHFRLDQLETVPVLFVPAGEFAVRTRERTGPVPLLYPYMVNELTMFNQAVCVLKAAVAAREALVASEWSPSVGVMLQLKDAGVANELGECCEGDMPDHGFGQEVVSRFLRDCEGAFDRAVAFNHQFSPRTLIDRNSPAGKAKYIVAVTTAGRLDVPVASRDYHPVFTIQLADMYLKEAHLPTLSILDAISAWIERAYRCCQAWLRHIWRAVEGCEDMDKLGAIYSIAGTIVAEFALAVLPYRVAGCQEYRPEPHARSACSVYSDLVRGFVCMISRARGVCTTFEVLFPEAKDCGCAYM